MKRTLLACLLAMSAGACSHQNKPTETAFDEREQQDDAHLYGSTESTATADGDAVTVPQHRASDELASTGEVPDTSRPSSVNSADNTDAATMGTMPRDAAPGAGGIATPNKATAPDNTGVNERDRGGATLTPTDQSEQETDVKLTQDIRRALVGNDGLSFSSKNVKVITRSGKVTLRGTVPNARERNIVEEAAKTFAGPGLVDNQLEVSNK